MPYSGKCANAITIHTMSPGCIMVFVARYKRYVKKVLPNWILMLQKEMSLLFWQTHSSLKY